MRIPPGPAAAGPRSRSRAGSVVVSYNGRPRLVVDGQRLTIGRSPSCDIRLPADGLLARFAARLENQGNISATKPIALRPSAGEDRVIEPGAAITSLPHRRFAIVLSGGLGDIGIDVDAGGLLPPSGGPDVPSRVRDAPDDFSGPIMWGSRRVLVALCRPILTRSGAAARPAAYAARRWSP